MSLYRAKRLKGDGLVGYRDGIEYKIMDDEKVMEFFDGSVDRDNFKLAEEFLRREDFFGEDMTRYSGLVDTVGKYLEQIKVHGMRKALETFLNTNKNTRDFSHNWFKKG